MSKKEISEERKVMYYIGMGMTGLGMLLFFSTFFVFLSPNFNPGGFILRPFIGVLLIGGGGFVRNIAARGIAGSGLVLDPERAREDLSPWTSMAGGMIEDAFEDTTLGKGKEIIKVRCQNCSELNEEDAKFCKNCGNKM